jgi:hypothetical protein
MKRTPRVPEVVTQERAHSEEGELRARTIRERIERIKRGEWLVNVPVSTLLEEAERILRQTFEPTDDTTPYSEQPLERIEEETDTYNQAIDAKAEVIYNLAYDLNSLLSRIKMVKFDELASVLLTNMGVDERHHELFVRLLEAARKGDETTLRAVQRAMDAPKEAAAPTERPAPQPLQLPEEIPESQWYKNRPKGQSLRHFLEVDGWPAPYVKAKILSRPELRKRDPSAYYAIYNTKEGVQLPPDLIPTKPQLVDEELSHLDRERVRDARRLASAERRRTVLHR